MITTPPQPSPLSSGQLANQTQLSRGALRLYEKHGLITPTHRTTSGYRMFTADTVVTLNAIKVACRAGFTLAEVRDLLGLVDAEIFSPAAVRATLNEKIAEVDARIIHLQQFKRFMSQVAKKPEILLDPACDAMLELAAMASAEPAQSKQSKVATKTSKSKK
jgi:MerR family transcriptional regulator, Zn(II)-responsive regulator of zntA